MGALNAFATSTLRSWLQHDLFSPSAGEGTVRKRGGRGGRLEKAALQEAKHALEKLQPLRLPLLLTLQKER